MGQSPEPEPELDARGARLTGSPSHWVVIPASRTVRTSDTRVPLFRRFWIDPGCSAPGWPSFRLFGLYSDSSASIQTVLPLFRLFCLYSDCSVSIPTVLHLGGLCSGCSASIPSVLPVQRSSCAWGMLKRDGVLLALCGLGAQPLAEPRGDHGLDMAQHLLFCLRALQLLRRQCQLRVC